jgi:hypothetical protein
MSPSLWWGHWSPSYGQCSVRRGMRRYRRNSLTSPPKPSPRSPPPTHSCISSARTRVTLFALQLWNSDHGHQAMAMCFKGSLKKLHTYMCFKPVRGSLRQQCTYHIKATRPYLQKKEKKESRLGYKPATMKTFLPPALPKTDTSTAFHKFMCLMSNHAPPATF